MKKRDVAREKVDSFEVVFQLIRQAFPLDLSG